MADVHVINLTDDGWTIQHPLSCRPRLFDCPVNRAAEQLTGPPVAGPGMWVCGAASDGELCIWRRATDDDLVADPGERTAAVLAEVAAERIRQDVKWGEQNHPDGTRFDDWADMRAVHAREVCQAEAAEGTLTWRHVLYEEVTEAFAETDPARLREELIQVAATAAVWVEAIDRRAASHG